MESQLSCQMLPVSSSTPLTRVFLSLPFFFFFFWSHHLLKWINKYTIVMNFRWSQIIALYNSPNIVYLPESTRGKPRKWQMLLISPVTMVSPSHFSGKWRTSHLNNNDQITKSNDNYLGVYIWTDSYDTGNVQWPHNSLYKSTRLQ